MAKAWWKDSKPEEIQPVPWIGSNAKRYFTDLLKPDMRVLEFGAGGSTLWMQDKVKLVISVENNQEWYRTIRDRAGENVIMVLWNHADPPNYELPFDLVFIDGEPIERRGNWIKALPRLVEPGGIIVLDNANRPEYEAEYFWLMRHARLLGSMKGKGGQYTWTEFFQWQG